MLYKCSNCNKEIDSEGDFCPQCGFKNSTKVETLSSGKKFKIYFMSFVFAPFGLYWFFKYFRKSEPELRQVGYGALIITVIALVVSTYTVWAYVKEIKNYSQLYEQQLDIYSQMGY